MNIHQHHRFLEDRRIADARALPPERGPGASLVAIWHAGWAVMVSLTALIAQTLPGAILAPTTQTALLLTALPGVLGVVLMARDTAGLRFLVMGGWLLAATAAAGLTGGVTGPVPGLVLLPLAAGIALDHARVGDDRLTRLGAVAVILPLLSGLISAWVNPIPAAAPALAAASGLLVLIALIAALRLTWGERRRRLTAAEADSARLTALLGDQPALTLVLDTAGRATAHWGAAPRPCRFRPWRIRVWSPPSMRRIARPCRRPCRAPSPASRPRSCSPPAPPCIGGWF